MIGRARGYRINVNVVGGCVVKILIDFSIVIGSLGYRVGEDWKMGSPLRRGIWFGVPFLIVCVLLSAPRSGWADDAAIGLGAEKFIDELVSKGTESLTAKEIDKLERRKRFRVLMHEYFAFKQISAFVLGRYWRRTTKAEQTEFSKLFEDVMVIDYADRFARYSGEKLEIIKSDVRSEGEVLVESVLKRPEGLKSVPVTWRVLHDKGEYKVFDVYVEGRSLAIAKQKVYGQFVRNNGRKVQALLDDLKSQLAKNP